MSMSDEGFNFSLMLLQGILWWAGYHIVYFLQVLCTYLKLSFYLIFAIMDLTCTTITY